MVEIFGKGLSLNCRNVCQTQAVIQFHLYGSDSSADAGYLDETIDTVGLEWRCCQVAR